MKAEDLRIGNYVNHWLENNIIQVKHIQDVSANLIGYSQLRPIPLTEEWLLKFGFDKSSCYWIKSNSNFFFGVHTEKGLMYLFDEEMMTPCDIKHVHQLQNLYFAITGTELTLK